MRVDFASDAIEAQVLEHGPANDYLWVEGQGSLLNPASNATLPLIRGSQPTHLVLVHKARMHHLQNFPDITIPPLAKVVALYELLCSAAGAFPPTPVVAVALNTWGLDDASAKAEIAATAEITGLPCSNVVRFGADKLFNEIVPCAHNLPAVT